MNTTIANFLTTLYSSPQINNLADQIGKGVRHVGIDYSIGRMRRKAKMTMTLQTALEEQRKFFRLKLDIVAGKTTNIPETYLNPDARASEISTLRHALLIPFEEAEALYDLQSSPVVRMNFTVRIAIGNKETENDMSEVFAVLPNLAALARVSSEDLSKLVMTTDIYQKYIGQIDINNVLGMAEAFFNVHCQSICRQNIILAQTYAKSSAHAEEVIPYSEREIIRAYHLSIERSLQDVSRPPFR